MDYNKYIFIPYGDKNHAINSQGVEIKPLAEGVEVYVKDDNNFLFKFDRKFWKREDAELFVLLNSNNNKAYNKAINILNGYEGNIEKSKRGEYYEILKSVYPSVNKLVSNNTFMINKSIKDKMKELAVFSNEKLSGHIEWANNNIPEVIKSTEETKAIYEKGFKFFGGVTASIVKSKKEEEEVSHYVLTTKFTSNRLDLDYEITSGNAIKSAINQLNGKVIPIRFEHGKEDFGVWHTFNYEEKNGHIYGIAQGELDMDLYSSRDLWKQIYDYGKQFATSYGGKVTKSHIEYMTERPVNIIDEIEFTEISLTATPANPDTAVEAINKHISTLIDSTLLIKNNSMNEEQAKETTQEVVEPTTEETSQVEVTASVTAPEEQKTSCEGEEENKEMPSQEEPEMEEAWSKMEVMITEMSSKLSSLEERLAKLENAPAEQKSVIVAETQKSTEVKSAVVQKSAGAWLLDDLSRGLLQQR